MNLLRISVFCVCSSFLISCGSSRSIQEGMEQSDSPSKIQPAGEPIPPNHCRIVGTVVGIDQTLNSSDPQSPCSKAPCSATVRVDSILGYGSAFGGSIAAGRQVQMSFGLTLSPTKGIFPQLTQSYPGLKVGASFVANVRLGEELGGKTSYSVNHYEAR